VTLLGHVDRLDSSVLRFRPDLNESVAGADAGCRDALALIDAFIAEHGPDVPPPDESVHNSMYWSHPAQPALTELDLAAIGISTVIWATGYRPDFSWIHLPAFAADGFPVQEWGVASYEGLYFPTLPGRDTILAALRDATHIAEAIIGRTAR
jgi:putative flavoprotein involved in K+ transport